MLSSDTEVMSQGSALLYAMSDREREFFIHNLLIRIHFVIEMMWWMGLATWRFEIHFQGHLISTFQSVRERERARERERERERAGNLEDVVFRHGGHEPGVGGAPRNVRHLRRVPAVLELPPHMRR